MKAMILAAGLGTRLRPLTEHRPKALLEIRGRTLLEITLRRLSSFGIDQVIVNVHYLGSMIIDYLQSNDNFGMRTAISREEVLLDTGGGLKQAAPFFLEGDTSEPFLLHNVDVVSTIDLRKMVEFHKQHQALATLAVQDRTTSRPLLFDDQLELCGRQTGAALTTEMARPAARTQALAFAGIHVISPRLLPMITEEGVFPIIPMYLRLAGQGERIAAFRVDEYNWRDVGRLEDLARAEEELRN